MALELFLDYGMLAITLILALFSAYKFFVISGKRYYLTWISVVVVILSVATSGNVWMQIPNSLQLLWIERLGLLALAITLFYVYYSKWG
ncbi:MAG: hypothetical protein QW331_00530 [Candidatus Woesearchaeota archaeon]